MGGSRLVVEEGNSDLNAYKKNERERKEPDEKGMLPREAFKPRVVLEVPLTITLDDGYVKINSGD